MTRRTAFDPVQYSASTRRAMAHMVRQIELTEDHLRVFNPRDPSDRMSELAKILGIAIALVALAEQHRRWDDAETYQSIQGRYARLVGDVRWNRTPVTA